MPDDILNVRFWDSGVMEGSKYEDQERIGRLLSFAIVQFCRFGEARENDVHWRVEPCSAEERPSVEMPDAFIYTYATPSYTNCAPCESVSMPMIPSKLHTHQIATNYQQKSNPEDSRGLTSPGSS